MTPFYRFYHYLARVLFWLFTKRVIVWGVEHVPPTGPAILISNHLSYSDPATIIGFVPRQVFFMAKSEMFNGGFMDWVISKAGAFPVRRGAVDLDAMRHALAVLKRGDLLGLYPEGTRSADHLLQPAHAGVVTIARQSGAPIVPVAITGMEHVFRRSFPWVRRVVVTITVGEPFLLSNLIADGGQRVARDDLAAAIMARVAALLPPAYHSIPAPVVPTQP